MSNGKNVGLFWGINAFSIVETQQDVPQKAFRVPFSPSAEADHVSPAPNDDDFRFIAPLKEALKANNIKAADVNLVLPSKDIVIRSFVIPFLKASEVRSVVEFEIKKYIPFHIKDLSFSFHAATFTEDKIKRMRVHFVAVRKEILERYKNVLQQVGLNVVYSEPAPMCLVRVLLQKKIIKSDQKVAIINTDFNDAGIIVVDKGIVQFVRDFQLQNPTLNVAPLDLEMLRKKLLNEIKISLDFYIRQFRSEKIEELYALSFASDQDLSATLQKELEISTKKVNLQPWAKSLIPLESGMLCAHGINLRGISKTVEFNLSGVMPVPTTTSKIQEKIPEEYIPAIRVAVVCAALLAVVFVLTKMETAQFKKRYEAIVDVQGAFVEMKPDEIKARITENQKKLKDYKIAYQPTEMAFLLTHISKLLPSGMWLTTIEAQYVKEKEKPVGSNQVQAPPVVSEDGASSPDRAILFTINGFAYTEDPNEQFKMVYALVNALKSDATLKKYAKNINLAGIQSQQSGDSVVTAFKVQVK